jgi:toxin FitB
MTYLLDTCIIAELISSAPDPALVRWVDAQPEETIFISVATLGEIKSAVDRIESAPKRVLLNDWLTNDLLIRFAGRISEINVGVTLKWGEVSAQIQSLGRTVTVVDTLNLAIALINDHTLVTSNLSIFENTGVRLINPFVDKTH